MKSKRLKNFNGFNQCEIKKSKSSKFKKIAKQGQRLLINKRVLKRKICNIDKA